MTGIGWEFYGVKFGMFVTMLATVIMFLSVWLGARRSDYFSHAHVDEMAGDEGED
jgi:hypothetical protein